jgi:biopolymer transport protein TolR
MPRLETTSPSSGGRSGRRGRGPRVSTALAEINVVPLVDVMLVLLVIFMVTAPMMQQGFEVNLPQSRQSKPISAEPIYVTVPSTFRRDSAVQLGDERMPLSVLGERVRQALLSTSTKDVYLRGDGAVTYADILKVMDALKAGGVEKVALSTQPPKTDR